MNVDIDALESLNLLTRDGAQQAEAVLSDAFGDPTAIGMTKIRFVDRESILEDLSGAGSTAIQFDIAGPITGTALLRFDADATQRLAETLDADPDAGGLDAAGDLGGEMMGAFIANWGERLPSSLRVADRSVLADPDALEMETTGPDTDSILVFESTVTWRSGPGTVTISFAPDRRSLETALAVDGTDDGDADGQFGDVDGDSPFAMDDGDEGLESLSLDKLSVFSDLTKRGTSTAAERLTGMTGIETDVEVAGISFTPIDDISSHLEDGDYVGATVAFEGMPSGHLVIMFDEPSAINIAESMLPMEPDGEGLTDMHKSALEELGNVMTSGFIDGWANVLQTSVDHTPPEYVDDMDMSMMEIITSQLGPFQTHAFTIDSAITTDEVTFDCKIHALPDESGLEAALNALLVERAEQTEADPDDLF
jgi:chemotaxis protein CheY-P-specific phosphatase CheC